MARKNKAWAGTGPVDEPWELPEGWHWEQLGDLGEWFGGGTPSKSVTEYWTNGDIPWVSPKDMKRFDLNDTEDHITSAAVAGSSTKLVPAQSVICVMRSGILKHSFPVAVTGRSMTLNQDLRAVHPRRDVAPRYLGYFLRSSAQSILHECSKDGTTVDSIDVGQLMQVSVPLPRDVDRQVAIVNRIDSLFAEVDEGEVALAEARSGVETYRKSLLKAAVTGELTADWRRQNPPRESGADLLRRILEGRRARWEAEPKSAGKKYVEPDGPDTEELPELPTGWTWATLQQIAFVSGGATVDGKRQPADPVELPYLRVANVQRGALDLRVLKSIVIERQQVRDLLLKPGDILLNEGGDRDKVGRGWVWEGQLETCAHQNHVFKARPVSNLVQSRLVSMYLNELGRRYFLDESKQTTNLASISLGKVNRAVVPIMPIEEAESIMAILADTSKPELDDLLALRETAGQLRQSILSAAFRGELTA